MARLLRVGTLAGDGAGGTATFAVTAVNPMPAGITQLANSASIADDGTNGTDPNPGNNTGSDATPITGGPDLFISAVAEPPGSVLPGTSIVYTLTYGNKGNRGASGVKLTETVPAGTTFVGGGSTAGWACVPDGDAGSTCTLAVGPIAGAGGGSADPTAKFAVRLLNPLPDGASSIVDSASIADDGTNGPDPAPGNNSTSVTNAVTPAVAQVPTLSAAGLAILALLLAAAGSWRAAKG